MKLATKQARPGARADAEQKVVELISQQRPKYCRAAA